MIKGRNPAWDPALLTCWFVVELMTAYLNSSEQVRELASWKLACTGGCIVPGE
jgi:hypothetical protein